MNWNREMLKGDFSLANSWFKDNREKVFCIGLWLEMRSGYSTTPSRRKNTTKPGQLLPSTSSWPTSTHSWFEDHALYLVGPKESCLLWAVETWRFHYRAIGIGYNWFVWVVHCEKNGRNTSKDMIKLFFFMTTPHVAKVIKKYLEMLKWDFLPHPPYSPDITPSDDWLFWRMQQVTGSLLWQKSKIGSKIGSPPKTSHFFEMEFENCLRNGKK